MCVCVCVCVRVCALARMMYANVRVESRWRMARLLTLQHQSQARLSVVTKWMGDRYLLGFLQPLQKDHVCTLKILWSCQSLVDYGNTKVTHYVLKSVRFFISWRKKKNGHNTELSVHFLQTKTVTECWRRRNWLHSWKR